jgi:hypothetical protein
LRFRSRTETDCDQNNDHGQEHPKLNMNAKDAESIDEHVAAPPDCASFHSQMKPPLLLALYTTKCAVS